MSLSKVYGDVLLPFVQKYKDARNEKERKAVMKNAAEAVVENRNLLENKGGNLPKDLPNVRIILSGSVSLLKRSCFQAIDRYLKGIVKKEAVQKEAVTDEADAKPKKIKQSYTLRDVVKQHHRDLVEKEIPYAPTDKQYIGSYQRAVTTVLNNMTKKELKEAETMVESWNEQGSPADVQLK